MMKNSMTLKQKCLSGQSLVSLMLSVSLSSFLLLVILQFYSQHQQQNLEILLRLQLQTELQRVIQLIGKDLARAGFRAASDKLTKDNLSLFEQQSEPSEDCQRYTQQSACNHGGWVDLLDEKEYEISDLTFTWLAEQKGIEVRLIGNLKQHKKISYETAIVVPLLNREES